MPDARIFVTSLTDEARWNDRSATIPGNDSKLSDGTLCDPQLDANGAQSPARRRQIQAAEQRYDAILRDVCSRDVHCRYDGGAFFRLEYDREDVAPTDAFHPSVRGLRRMAATAWTSRLRLQRLDSAARVGLDAPVRLDAPSRPRRRATRRGWPASSAASALRRTRPARGRSCCRTARASPTGPSTGTATRPLRT